MRPASPALSDARHDVPRFQVNGISAFDVLLVLFWMVADFYNDLKASGQVLLVEMYPVPVEPAGTARSMPPRSCARHDVPGSRSMGFSAFDVLRVSSGQVLLMEMYPVPVELAGTARSMPSRLCARHHRRSQMPVMMSPVPGQWDLSF